FAVLAHFDAGISNAARQVGSELTCFFIHRRGVHIMSIRFKICCMSSEEEIRLALDAGADALGFVSQMPSGAGIISEDLIRRLVPLVPPPIATFLLTCRDTFDAIAAQQRRCKANTLQLCDSVHPSV